MYLIAIALERPAGRGDASEGQKDLFAVGLMVSLAVVVLLLWWHASGREWWDYQRWRRRKKRRRSERARRPRTP